MASKVFKTGLLTALEREILHMDDGGEIRSLNLFNQGGGQQTVLISVKTGKEAKRPYARVVRDTNERADVIDNPLNLGVGDGIWASASSDGAIAFVISGVVD